MKKLFYLCIALLSASVLMGCGPSEAERKQKEAAERARVQDSIEQAHAAAEAQMEAQLEQEKQELKDFAQNFYSRVSKASPVLPMLTSDFSNVLRHAQSSTGNDGIKGYVRYCFCEDGLNGSSSSVDAVNAEVSEVIFNEEEQATVKCVMNCHYQGEVTEWQAFHDEMQLVKVGGEWKIADIVRDGNSLKSMWKSNPPFIP